jgi:hypothetical protein
MVFWVFGNLGEFMEIYNEYVVWDHEVMVGFYVSKDLKAKFDHVCRCEGERNGEVLRALMGDYIALCEISAERDELESKREMEEGMRSFLEKFGVPKAANDEGAEDLSA